MSHIFRIHFKSESLAYKKRDKDFITGFFFLTYLRTIIAALQVQKHLSANDFLKLIIGHTEIKDPWCLFLPTL